MLHGDIDMNGLQFSLRLIKGGLSGAGETAMKTRKVKDTGVLASSKVYHAIAYQTLSPGSALALPSQSMSEIIPVSNLPAIDDAGLDKDGIPSKRDFTIYRLKRQITALRENEKQLLGKLTRCQEVINDQKRFLEIGLTYGHWETLGELMQRKARLGAMVDLINDNNANPDVLSEDEYQKVKVKL